MSAIASIYCVFSDGEEAARIGRQVIEERLAACINILAPCRSIYRWQGRIEEAEEVPAILKCSEAVAPQLIERIAELHSYDVPAIVAWPVAHALPAYEKWIA